ncbi:DUF3800 domain-containing protein [Xanthomonas hortorum pv. pelargonii]|nr:DUF3800 domain-containing protein [Xanthomonas hortorum pv. pelargonii]
MPRVAGQFSLPLVHAESEPVTSPPLATANAQYSNYIVYVDESGDHGLETLDPNYPVFVLAFASSTKVTTRNAWFLPSSRSSSGISGMTWSFFMSMTSARKRDISASMIGWKKRFFWMN